MRGLKAGLCALGMLAACSQVRPQPGESRLYVFSLEESVFHELGADLTEVGTIPFSVPQGCAMGTVNPAPRGPRLAIELSCAFGPAVVWLDVQTSTAEQAITTSDSHFLAWAPTGEAAYLKIDSVNRPRVVRVDLDGHQEALDISEYTYDLAPSPDGTGFVFSFSRGMGLGSEMWFARGEGGGLERLAADEENYVAFARWSPDGARIAFIKIPDSPTPFTVGELWVMRADGTEARLMASADAGHGFAPAWSPDGTRIAFIARENVEDPSADVSSSALISNLHMVDLRDGSVVRLTDYPNQRVTSPAWQPNGEAIAFSVGLDDRMAVLVHEVGSRETQQVPLKWICCPSWLNR